MGLSHYKSFHAIFSVSFYILIFFSIWGGIVCVVWEPQQASTGWVVELPNVSAIYFPKDDLSATPGMIETRSELRQPTSLLRNSYLVFFFLNAIFGGIAQLFYYLNFEKTFVCMVIIWAIIGFINTGAVGAVNSKFLKDFLTDLGNREGEILKLMELDLMFQLFQLRTNESNLTQTEERLEAILNATIENGTVVRRRDSIRNITIMTPEAEAVEHLKEAIEELKVKESDIVGDLKKVATKIGSLKYLKSCYSERACHLTKYYDCIYGVSILACVMYIVVFFIACHAGCCGLPNDGDPNENNTNLNTGFDPNNIGSHPVNPSPQQQIHRPIKRSIVHIPSNRPAGDLPGYRPSINNNPAVPDSSSTFFASASPSVM